MVRHFSGRVPHPIPLEGPGVTLDRMRAFAEAGAAFYRAAPWQYLTDMDLIEIEKPDAPQTCRLATVLGAGGVTFGLGFYATIKDYARARKIDRPGAGGAPLPNDMWHLTFGPITELSTYDPDLWEDHDLPVAGAQAYPYVLGLMTSRQVVRANAGELAFVEGLLRALARTTEHQIDSGRWESRVDTFDGPMTFTLALPDLLEPPTPKELIDRGYEPEQRGMESGLAQMHRYFEEHPAANMDEMNAVLQEKFAGKAPDNIGCQPRTPLEKAQDLCYKAFDARGRRCVQLARQALEICPDCADAYVILAEHAGSYQAELAFCNQGMQAGQRALG